MKFSLLLISVVAGVAVKDGQICNTNDGCVLEDSKCCYATGKSEAAKTFDGMYCVKDTQTNIMTNG